MTARSCTQSEWQRPKWRQSRLRLWENSRYYLKLGSSMLLPTQEAPVMAQYLGKLQIQLGSSTHFQVSWGTIHCPDITGLSQDTSEIGWEGGCSGPLKISLLGSL